ncbi:hypothetical protein I547_3087 [Mycobacterium kansasii 824]|nr:hypothetical protein I547_3087 [Mycobacterium kansasii 824]
MGGPVSTPVDGNAGLRSLRRPARRLPPLRARPGHRRTGRGAVAAIEHLDAHGYPGLADYRTCRGMWRIGQRALAVAVHRRTSGEVA